MELGDEVHDADGSGRREASAAVEDRVEVRREPEILRDVAAEAQLDRVPVTGAVEAYVAHALRIVGILEPQPDANARADLNGYSHHVGLLGNGLARGRRDHFWRGWSRGRRRCHPGAGGSRHRRWCGWRGSGVGRRRGRRHRRRRGGPGVGRWRHRGRGRRRWRLGLRDGAHDETQCTRPRNERQSASDSSHRDSPNVVERIRTSDRAECASRVVRRTGGHPISGTLNHSHDRSQSKCPAYFGRMNISA
jgi:hypothetical protein